ncbi:MAG: response regulator [Lachnospiraceae bacterium]|nr:response regulator [Lachnospiraceae bacterium]
MAEGFEKFIKFGDEEEVRQILGNRPDRSDMQPDANEDFVLEEDLETPDIRPVRSESGKPTVVVIDDDYQTLDIMKIYLARDYECAVFSDPKEAIFYMNTHLPDIIFMDSYMTVMSAKKMISIIRLYKEMKNVPIYFMVYEEERDVFEHRKDTEVEGLITRPIARGELQKILDKEKLREYLTKD